MAASHINESVILEEVMSTHDPDGKENFKINVIFDLVKSILYPITIGDSIDEDGDSDKEDSNGEKSDEEDSNGDKSDEEDTNGDKSDEEDSNGEKSHEEDSNGDKSDEEDTNGDKSDEEDSNGEKSDEEDSNGDKSDEEDSNSDKSDGKECDDKKSNEEESDNGNKMSFVEKVFDSEEEYTKDMELPYQLKRFSFEISLMCPNNVNIHSMVIYFLRMLSTFSWESKLLIMLAAFSLNFGEFSLAHRHNGLSGKLAILKGREYQVLPMVTHFIKSILHLTEHIVELAQSSSHNSSPIIPIGCYQIVISILTYASYFTSGLKSMHSRCFIGGERQLSSLTVKIKDVISDCRPILEKKREVDSYNALCDAFFDENPIFPSTSSNLDVLKLVFNVKKGGKQELIYDGARKEMVELCLLENRSLLLSISSNLDIPKYLISILNFLKWRIQLRVLWIPILDSSTVWDIKRMEIQYRSLVNRGELLSVRNVQKSVASGFVRFVKEKFFPTFQIGGEPIIVSLDQNGRMVHRNAIHMVLMRAIDLCQRMSGGIKTRDSIIPLLQKVLMERVSTVRDLVPTIDQEIYQVTGKVDGIITDWFDHIEKQIQNPVDNNIFTSEREKDLWKIETWCTKLVANFGEYTISEWVEEDRCFFLIGGHDIQWVKTFESKVILAIQFNPQSEIEMHYVGSNIKVASMIEEDKDCNVVSLPKFSWIFWPRLRSIFLSRIKFVEETRGNEECDEILRRLKKLLAYEANDLVVSEWAMLCKGNKIVVCDQGDKMLKVMNEYDKWKENAIAKGFDQAFKDYHEMLDSTSTSQHHHRCALEYPCNFDSVSENVKCPQCCYCMQKFVTFKCYHDNVDDDEDDLL